MSKRYVLWDHVSTVITPSGEVFTPEEWEVRYPAAKVIDYVMAAGAMNGALMQDLSSMVRMAEEQGADFSNISTAQEVLDAIEAWEDSQAAKAEQEEAEAAERRRQAEEEEAELLANSIETNNRIADALEDLAVLQMPDIEEV